MTIDKSGITDPPGQSAGGDSTRQAPVLPHVRVVPGGVENGNLRLTLLLSPDLACSATANTGFALSHWPRDIVDAIAEGREPVLHNPPEMAAASCDCVDERTAWHLPLWVARAAAVPSGQAVPAYDAAQTIPCPGQIPAVTVMAKARLLQEAYGNSDVRARLLSLWQLQWSGTDWMKLAERATQSLSANRATAGDIAKDKAVFTSDVNYNGNGEVTTKVEPTQDKRVDSILAVPHADLAVALEYGRAEELAQTLHEIGGGPSASEREAERLKLCIGACKNAVANADSEDCETYQDPGKRRECWQRKAGKARENEHKSIANSISLMTQRSVAAQMFENACAEAAATECSIRNLATPWASRPTYLSGTDDAEKFAAARDAQDYIAWTQRTTSSQTTSSLQTAQPSEEKRLQVEDENTQIDDLRLATLQSTPVLARLFALAVDVEIPLCCLPLDWHTGEGSFVYVACPFSPLVAQTCGMAASRPLPWSLAKLRDDHFWPATEAEMRLPTNCPPRAENMVQFEGHLVMSGGWSREEGEVETIKPARFDITSLDLRPAADGEAQRRAVRQAQAQRVVDQKNKFEDLTQPHAAHEKKQLFAGQDEEWEELAYGRTFLTGGLTLLDRGAQAQAIGRLASAHAKTPGNGEIRGCAVRPATSSCTAGHIVLDALDLTIGYRLDAGTPHSDGTQWNTLSSRRVSWGTSGNAEAQRFIHRYLPTLTESFNSPYRISLDSAVHATVGRYVPLKAADSPDSPQAVEAAMDEAFLTWTGAPLGLDPTMMQEKPTSQRNLLPYGRTVFLPDQQSARFDPYLLPQRLRYGHPYRVKLRAVYQGGLSVPVRIGTNRADTNLDGRLAYPPAEGDSHLPYFRWLRQARLAPPEVMMDEDTANQRNYPMPWDDGLRMVVRSLAKDTAQEQADRGKPSRTRRLLMPPRVVGVEAERHGEFDRSQQERLPKGGLAGARMADNGGLPVTATSFRIGINNARHFTGRNIVGAPETERDRESDTDLRNIVLTAGSAGKGRYYPDPAADVLVLALRYMDHHEGRSAPYVSQTYVPLRGGSIQSGPSIARVSWPDVLPVAIELVAVTERSGNPRITWQGSVAPPEGTLGGKRLARAVVNLLPGERMVLEAWCAPSADRLAREFSIVQSLAIAIARNPKRDPLPQALDNLGLKRSSRAGDAGPRYVGPGGLLAPPARDMRRLADELHAILLHRPLPDIAAQLSLPLIHATNRPSIPPQVSDLQVFRPSPERLKENWSSDMAGKWPNADEGATAFALDGNITVPLSTTGSIEIVAEVTLPHRTIFDDPERGRTTAQHRTGYWPDDPRSDGTRSIRKAVDLFGFKVRRDGKVELPKAEVTLLRIENLPPTILETTTAPGTPENLPLLPYFLGTGEDRPDVHGRPTGGYVFPDGKARHMTVWARGMSRTAPDMTRIARVQGLSLKKEELLHPNEQSVAGIRKDLVLPASIRPLAPRALSPYPIFSWSRSQVANHTLYLERKVRMRLPLGRGWFSSGVDERLGIILWPPDLTAQDERLLAKDFVSIPKSQPNKGYYDLENFIDEDLGPGGGYISRMGADPIRSAQPGLESPDSTSSRPGLFLGPNAFRGPAMYVPRVTVPLASESNADNGAADDANLGSTPTLTVGLVTFEPRFDPASETWYVDLDLDTGPLAEPFVRLGLVRYQPHAPERLCASTPVVQWLQPIPWRRARVVKKEIKNKEETEKNEEIQVRVWGPAGHAWSKETKEGLADAALGAPRMRARLFVESSMSGLRQMHEIEAADGTVSEIKGASSPYDMRFGPAAQGDNDIRYWNLVLSNPKPEDIGDGRLVLFLEEFDLYRPAQYAVEPTDPLGEESSQVVASGPRFAARFDIGDLRAVATP